MQIREVKLNKGLVALVDDEDYAFINQWKWYARKSRGTFYAGTRGQNGTIILMHRLILKVIDSNIFIDHRDGNGLNNSKENLRVATKMQNAYNMKSNEGTSSRFKGVCWREKNKCWTAQISANKVTRYIGSFKSEIDAAIAYNKEAEKLHGEFALFNNINN